MRNDLSPTKVLGESRLAPIALVQDVDVQIESGHPSYGRMNSDEKAQHDWKNFSAETSVKNETVEKAREEIKQSRSEEAAQQSQQHETEAQTQKQKHER